MKDYIMVCMCLNYYIRGDCNKFLNLLLMLIEYCIMYFKLMLYVS